MTNKVVADITPMENRNAEQVLNAMAKEDLQDVFIVGVAEDGHLMLSSNGMSGGSILWVLELAKLALLEGE